MAPVVKNESVIMVSLNYHVIFKPELNHSAVRQWHSNIYFV